MLRPKRGSSTRQASASLRLGAPRPGAGSQRPGRSWTFAQQATRDIDQSIRAIEHDGCRHASVQHASSRSNRADADQAWLRPRSPARWGKRTAPSMPWPSVPKTRPGSKPRRRLARVRRRREAISVSELPPAVHDVTTGCSPLRGRLRWRRDYPAQVDLAANAAARSSCHNVHDGRVTAGAWTPRAASTRPISGRQQSYADPLTRPVMSVTFVELLQYTEDPPDVLGIRG